MYKFLFFDEQDPAVPEEIVEAADDEGATSEPDYSQLLYEYLSSQDVITGTRQEEMYAVYTEKLDSIDAELKQLNQNMEWTVAFLLFFAVLVLFRSVRGWVTVLIGGKKNVY